MKNLENNKLFAAFLIALLVALISSLISEKVVSPTFLEENVYKVTIKEEGSTPTSTPPTEEPITLLLAKADASKGHEVATKCLQCHSFEKGGPNKLGPNLWNILSMKMGHLESYPYSTALKGKEGTWTYETLDQFLKKPKEFIPGTKMSFVGLAKAEERAHLIAYLRSLSDAPLPLPTP